MKSHYTDLFKSVVLGALFHDIGKFYQRADENINYKNSTVLDNETKNNIDLICPLRNNRYSHKHALWTFQFLKEKERYLKRFFDDISALNQDNFINLASYHHNPSSPLQHLIQFADRISSGMERENLQDDLMEDESSKFNFRTVRLKPIFELISFEQSKEVSARYKHNIQKLKLDRESIFPQEAEKLYPAMGDDLGDEYRKLWGNFESDFGLIPNANFYYIVYSFLGLLEKYAWCIPSSTSDRPDISLFDHLKTTAAIASCIYVFHDGNIESKDTAVNREKEKFILLGGDLSGIQNYIFNLARVNLKKVSKMLRARSFYLTLLPKIIVTKILFENGLTPANSLMETGGRFVLLLPNTEGIKKYLENLSNELGAWCMEEFYGELTVNLDWSVALSANDFFEKRFAQKYEELLHNLEKKKLRKFDFVTTQSWNDTIFVVGSDYNKLQDQDAEICRVCGKKPATRTVTDEENESTPICDSCYRQQNVGTHLTKNNYFTITQENSFDGISFPFSIGSNTYVVRLQKNWSQYKDYLNNESFITGFKSYSAESSSQFVPTEFIAKHVPRFTLQEATAYKKYYQSIGINSENLDYIQAAAMKTFSDISIPEESLQNPTESYGVRLLAILKADVDNLGLIFRRGLRENMSISRYSTLSRMINLFFSGYLNEFIETHFPNIYTVYAGGDDVFLIGNWQDIIHFAPMFNKEFSLFTCKNEDIHLSAAIELIKPNSPIYRGARLVEESLEKAKSRMNGPFNPVKNSLFLFNELLEWNEWNQWIHDWIIFLDKKLYISRLKNKNPGENTKINSAFLYRLLHYQQMYRDYLQNRNIRGLLYLSYLSYDIKRNISMKESDNRDIRNELRKLAELQKFPNDKMKKIHIPIFYALYKNRGG